MDLDLTVEDVVLIGNYVSFNVTVPLEENANADPRPSVFAILMNKDKSSLPPRETNALNNKKRLRNSIIDWLESNKLFFTREASTGVGEELVVALTDVFWYIDGQHKTLADRSHTVPDIFRQFSDYNLPEVYKHKKKATENMQSSNLKNHSSVLFRICGTAYMKSANWLIVRRNLLQLADNLRQHADYLDNQNEVVTEKHRKLTRTDEYEWEVYAPQTVKNPTLIARYKNVNQVILQSLPYVPVFMNEYAPNDSRRRYEFLKGLYFECKVVRFSYTTSREHLHFLWKINRDDSETVVQQKNDDISDMLKQQFPKYFSRAMKQHFIETIGKITSDKPMVLREIFRRLTGDSSADRNQYEKEISDRIREALDGEDDTLIWDLRINNSGRPEQYIPFLEECQKYIESKVQTVVQERRHAPLSDGEVVTYMATALNARTLYEAVVKQCPEGVAIPSQQWLKWQFWPRHAGKLSAKRYTGRIKIRYMVQSRQFRKNHVDSYYASALWGYQKEFAIKALYVQCKKMWSK